MHHLQSSFMILVYERNMFIVRATGAGVSQNLTYLLGASFTMFIVHASLTIITYDHHL